MHKCLLCAHITCTVLMQVDEFRLSRHFLSSRLPSTSCRYLLGRLAGTILSGSKMTAYGTGILAGGVRQTMIVLFARIVCRPSATQLSRKSKKQWAQQYTTQGSEPSPLLTVSKVRLWGYLGVPRCWSVSAVQKFYLPTYLLCT